MVPVNQNLGLLVKLLDSTSLRQKVLAQNVANVNTPGYREREVRFEDAFARALARGNETAAKKVRPEIVEGLGGADRVDGNNVDIDKQMADLTKNNLMHRLVTQIMTSNLSTMRSAISGR